MNKNIKNQFIVSIFVSCLTLAQTQIPQLINNVVDSKGYLSSIERLEVEKKIGEVRKKSDIWSAVYILDTLNNESIEALANRAFNSWKLGDAKKDNGLLLLVAINDRKVRLEVGYGLEGSLTDLSSKRILDSFFVPLMRKNQLKNAILETLSSAAGYYKGEVTLPNENDFFFDAMGSKTLLKDYPVQIFSYFFYYLLLLSNFFLIFPLRRFYAKRLSQKIPNYNYLKDTNLSVKKGVLPSILIFCFLSINPGVFIVVLPFILVQTFKAAPILAYSPVILLIAFGFYISFKMRVSQYLSVKNYQNFIDKQKAKWAEDIENGYAEYQTAGVYTYTKKYYSSAKYRRSRSSSSSSSSSSGGGSSGGGGASSSW